MSNLTIDKEGCKGCGLCIEACPKKVLAFSKELNKSGYFPVEEENPQACTACTLCAIMCPDCAIQLGSL